MKKRYYLSMLSLFPLIFVFDSVYFLLHQSLVTFFISTSAHFVLFGLINFIGIYLLYKPIDHVFVHSENTEQAKKQINHLTWYSAGWVFFLGFFNVAVTFLPLLLSPSLYNIDIFSMDKALKILWLDFIPTLLFIYAIFPSFIIYFLINDYSLDLKTKAFNQLQIIYPAGKKKVGLTLLFVFIILGLFPTLLVILDLTIVSSVGNEYASFQV